MSSSVTTDSIEVLSGLDLFKGLKPKVLKPIAESVERASYAAGESILTEGDSVGGFKPFSHEGVRMHVVIDGSAVVHVNGSNLATFGTVGPGEYFGELSLIDGEPRSADVLAGPEGVTTISLTSWAFRDLLETHPEAAVPMLAVLCARLRRAEAVGLGSDDRPRIVQD